MSDPLLGYLLASGALLLFTASILITKAASSRLDLGLGFLIATSTNVAFSALALLVQMQLRTDTLQWNLPAFFMFAAAGGFSTYLGRWFFYESVVRFGPAKASIFQISSPLFTAMMAWLLLGERLTPLVALGMVMTIAGLMLVSCKPDFFSRRSSPVAAMAPDGEPAPAVTKTPAMQRLMQSVLLLGMGSSLAYAIGNVLRGSAVRSWNEPILGALIGAACGLALQVAFSADKGAMVSRVRAARRSGMALFATIGVTTISAQMCAIGAMRYIPLSVATLVTLCTPILVFPLSHLLFKNQDKVTAITLAGSGLTLLGIFIIVMR
ncbi:DMT family transporter [Polaromonas sp. LjRoot131]|uniref:DMT family transporter n=1 Tax=Polaromonas sp. LjRoot131 TaxID=3342262 RepID=UPI003ECED2B3